MIELQNKDLEPLALQLQSFGMKNGNLVPIFGLLHEDITLGMKRRLQKIRKAVVEHLKSLESDQKEIREKFPVKLPAKGKELSKKAVSENAENKKKQDAEMEILLNEMVKIDLDKVSLEMVENIKTEVNYDFDLLEKIAE